MRKDVKMVGVDGGKLMFVGVMIVMEVVLMVMIVLWTAVMMSVMVILINIYIYI